MSRPDEGNAITAQGLVLLIALILAWGTMWPAMKLALTETPIFTFRALCVIFGATGLFLIARLRGDRLTVPRALWRPLVIASLFNITGWFYFSSLALTLMPATRATIIAYTMPLWAFLFGIPVLGERPSAKQWLGLGVGMTGVAVLIGDDLAMVRQAPLGVLAMLGGAISFGAGAVVQKRYPWRTPVLALTGWQIVIGGAPLVVGAIFLDLDRLAPVSLQTVLVVIYTIAVGVIFGIAAWLRLLALLPVQVASLSILLIPMVGLISSALWLGEPVGWQELSALALVVVAVSRVVPMPRLTSFRRN
jgi:drug/metabolite transporter (DMT)-like permease